MLPYRTTLAVAAVVAAFAAIATMGQKGSDIVPGIAEDHAPMRDTVRVGQPTLPATQRDALPPAIPTPYPNKGVILGRRGLYGLGDWTVVDLDTNTVERLTLRPSPDGNTPTKNDGTAARPLSAAEADAVAAEADTLWRSPPLQPASVPPAPTDSRCNVVLLDSRGVLFGEGGTCPAGTERLVGMIEGLQSPAPP